MCEADNRQEAAAQRGQARLALCEDPEAWRRSGGRLGRKGVYVHNCDSFPLVYGGGHSSVSQRLSSNSEKGNSQCSAGADCVCLSSTFSRLILSVIQRRQRKDKSPHFLHGQKIQTDISSKKVCRWPRSRGEAQQHSSLERRQPKSQ